MPALVFTVPNIGSATLVLIRRRRSRVDWNIYNIPIDVCMSVMCFGICIYYWMQSFWLFHIQISVLTNKNHIKWIGIHLTHKNGLKYIKHWQRTSGQDGWFLDDDNLHDYDTTLFQFSYPHHIYSFYIYLLPHTNFYIHYFSYVFLDSSLHYNKTESKYVVKEQFNYR